MKHEQPKPVFRVGQPVRVLADMRGLEGTVVFVLDSGLVAVRRPCDATHGVYPVALVEAMEGGKG